MFGRSKVMHIPDADDATMAAFEAHEINELVAYCGARIARGWLFGVGGARADAPICPVDAEADGWDWDPENGVWLSPYDEYEQAR
jgi:hypothetical protein